MKRLYVATSIAHVILLLGQWFKKKYFDSNLPFKLNTPFYSILTSIFIGVLFATYEFSQQEDTFKVDDKLQFSRAEAEFSFIESELLSDLRQVKKQNDERLRLLSRIFGGIENPEELERSLDRQREDMNWFMDSGLDHIVIVEFDGSDGNKKVITIPKLGGKLPPYVSQVLKLSEAKKLPAVIWSEELSYLVVSDYETSENKQRWISASIWEEKQFLESTTQSWKERNWELFLVGESNKVYYTTEISDYGEPLNGMIINQLPTGVIGEISTFDGTRYQIEKIISDGTLLDGLKIRLQFPPITEVSSQQIGKLIFLILLLSVLILLFQIVEHEEHKPEPEPEPSRDISTL